jgi:type II secretory pathway component GspD/PulD (secretin)
MSKRLYLAGSFVAALLVLSPATSRAQAARTAHITIEWQNAELSDVVNAFAKFSGSTIVLAPDVRSSPITFAVRDQEWRTAFDAMLAREALVARADKDGIIHVEKRGPTQPGSHS